MRYLRKLSTARIGVLTGLFMAFWLIHSHAASATIEDELYPDLSPKAELSASDVVRIQLEALANNDTPRQDAGIELTFRFASPTNRKATGPLSRFASMIKSPNYRPMLYHKFAKIGEIREKNGLTLVPVLLTTNQNTNAGYLFVLSQYYISNCQGCWFTDSVIRIAQAENPVEQSIEPPI